MEQGSIEYDLNIFNVPFSDDAFVILLLCISHVPVFHPSNQVPADIFQLILANAMTQKLLEEQGHEVFPVYLPTKVQDHALELPINMELSLVPAWN